MGDLRPDNGGSLPPDDGGSHPEGLPDLPADWGVIVIPDDAAELAAEASALRKELRRQQGWRRRLSRGGEPGGIGVPLIIMAVAVFTTLLSLFVVSWDSRPTRPATRPSGTPGSASTTVALTELTFTDSAGRNIRLGPLLPGVIMLVDGCGCADLVLQTGRTVPAGVSVIVVDRTAPVIANAPANVHSIADPEALLRSGYAPARAVVPGRPTVLLVSRTGEIAATLPSPASVAEIQPHLSALPTAQPSKTE